MRKRIAISHAPGGTMKSASILLSLFLAAPIARAQDVVGAEIAPWRPGTLDIHQISSGRGNAGLYIFPDGTTLLVDAGELPVKTPRHTPDRPDASRRVGERFARYIRHALRHDPDPRLDYVLLTHFHEDHMGGPADDSPVASSGAYKLTGITAVAEHLRIGKLIDRGWPDYQPAVPENETMKNYRTFVAWQTKRGGVQVERFAPGRADQVVPLRDPQAHPEFQFRNVGVNGEIWTGVAQETRQQFPPMESLPRPDWPHENMYSASFRLSYGRFDYFNGGDIPGYPAPGAPAWHDVETPVAKAVGPVEAAILDHHGYIDSQNDFLIGALRPRVWVISVWDAGHPTTAVWQRLRSTRLYPGPRDVFATDLHEATRAVIGGAENMAASVGHVVLRVTDKGARYSVVIVDHSSESHRVTRISGPHQSR